MPPPQKKQTNKQTNKTKQIDGIHQEIEEFQFSVDKNLVPE